MASNNNVFSDAMMLPDYLRLDLAKQLLKSLSGESNSHGIDEEWGKEIERRLDALDAGTTSTRDFDESIAEIRKILQARTRA